MALSPGGKYVATSDANGELRLRDMSESHLIGSLKPGKLPLAAFSADGASFVAAGKDGSAVRVRLAGGREVNRFELKAEGPSALALSQDGRSLAVALADQTIRLYDEKAREVRAIRDRAGASALAFSPDGKRLVCAGRDRTVRLYDVETGDEVLALREHGGPVTGVAFSPDGKRLAASSMREVFVWSAGRAFPAR